MSTDNKQYIALEVAKEVLWWLISAVIATAIMWPLTSKLHYAQVWINGAILVFALTFFRYAIFLRHTYVLRSKWVRFILVVFNINLFVYVIKRMQGFMNIYDSFTINEMGTPIRPLQPEEVDPLFRYFFNEINFACVACMGLIVALTVRIIISHWQTAHLRLNAGSEE